MLAHNCEGDIKRALDSASAFVDAIIVGIDSDTTDNTSKVVKDYAKNNPLDSIVIVDVEPVLETGFSAARNKLLDLASSYSWVLALDADEVVVNCNELRCLMADNIDGVSIPQHHLSVLPAKVIKTDYPIRLFRTTVGAEYYGVVHEHPEVELNKSIPRTVKAVNTAIAHYGYYDEDTRRKRFLRNLPLVVRDREENPARVLGKYLWLRDLAYMTKFDMDNGVATKDKFNARIGEGLLMWRDIIKTKNLHLTLQGLEHVSPLTKLIGGLDVKLTLEVGVKKDNTKTAYKVHGNFVGREDLMSVMGLIYADVETRGSVHE